MYNMDCKLLPSHLMKGFFIKIMKFIIIAPAIIAFNKYII